MRRSAETTPRRTPSTALRAVRRSSVSGGRIGDLTEQVDDLLAPPHEVASGHVLATEHGVQPLATGPPVHHPGHAAVGDHRRLQTVIALEVVELAPPPLHLA